MELKIQEPEGIFADFVKESMAKKDEEQPTSLTETQNTSTENASINAVSSEKSLQEAIELLEKCKEVYKDNKLEEAYRYKKQLEGLKDSLVKDDLPAFEELLLKEQETLDLIEEPILKKDEEQPTSQIEAQNTSLENASIPTASSENSLQEAVELLKKCKEVYKDHKIEELFLKEQEIFNLLEKSILKKDEEQPYSQVETQNISSENASVLKDPLIKEDLPASDELLLKQQETLDLVEEHITKKDEEQPTSQIEVQNISLENASIPAASSEKSLQEAIELLEKCKEVYKDHKLEEAYRFKKQLEVLKDSLVKDDLPAFEELLLKEQETFDLIEEEYVYLEKVLGELYCEEGWKHDKIDSNVQIAYKKSTNDLLIIKMEAEIDVPLKHLITMINEVELWKLWNAFMNKTAEVHTFHRAAKLYYVEYGLPYPLSNREIYLYGIGVNRLYENGTVMVLAESVNNDKEFFEKHKIKKIDHKGSIGIDVNVGGFEITPVGRNRCILKGIANINPKFDWIPKDLLNWVLRKGTKQMVDKIIAGAKKFKGSAWEKETKSERKRDFYEWLDAELEKYFVKKDAEKEEHQDQKNN